ncbi:MAG TPA: sensor histidine kinase [Paenibacillaceae bacterium]|nr:sensor histidine kinase [Paenibacillaceae bacterium]
MRNRILLLAFIILITFILGEVKLYFPVFGSEFRFSLSAAAFFFCLLWFRQLRVLEIGLGVSIFLPLFRVFLTMGIEGESFLTVFPNHAPAAIYYLTFTLLTILFSLRRYVNKTPILILLGVVCDLLSNVAELLIRGGLGQYQGWDTRFFMILVTFAALRVLFVVGFFNMFTLNQYRLLGEQQQKQIEQLMMINSGLYEEGFYLKKSMVQVEEITRDSYQLYRNLRTIEKENPSYTGFSRSALHIAEQIHELKKDSQRVISGLFKIINHEKVHGEMTFYEISEFVIHANQKYAEMLGKKIDEHQVNVFLVNTGWTGGIYGEGSRMKLSYTRKMVRDAIDGKLNDVFTDKDPIFGLAMPTAIEGVPTNLLNPRNAWANKEAYDKKATELAGMFHENFKKFGSVAEDIAKKGAPLA